MAKKTLTEILTMARILLRDPDGVDWEIGEEAGDVLLNHVAYCLTEISDYCPYKVKETLETEASKELDISTVEDLLEIVKVEYPVGNDPPSYRNCSIFGDVLTISIDSVPTAGDDIYLFCHKVHTLTEEASSLSPKIENVLIDGIVAYAALDWINKVRNEVKEAIARITGISGAVDNMTARITKAMEDLTTGRGKINGVHVGGDVAGAYSNYAAREMQNANTYLNQAGGYIRELTSRLNIAGIINSYQTWANNKLIVYRQELVRMVEPRSYQEYPKG